MNVRIVCVACFGLCSEWCVRIQVLKDFDVPCVVTVVSAHRTPERMFSFARTAHTRGVKVPPPLPPLVLSFVFSFMFMKFHAYVSCMEARTSASVRIRSIATHGVERR